MRGLLLPLFLMPGLVLAASKGEALYKTCISCHGKDGEGNKALKSPRIAGQEVWYLERQLNLYKSGKRGAHKKDLQGQQMRAMAGLLKDDAAVKAVAKYIAGLKGVGAKSELKADLKKGRELYNKCATCHGNDGRGKAEIFSPGLVGLDSWYLVSQLKSFKAGYRGDDRKDKYSWLMHLMAGSLTEEEMNNVVGYIGNLKEEKLKPKLSGNVSNGKKAYLVCKACHGDKGQGNLALKAPKIAGQEAWYLTRQLENYAAKLRGGNKEDTLGRQMQAMSITLNSDQKVADVVAYIGTFKVEKSDKKKAAVDKKGKEVYSLCASCHGDRGLGKESLGSPALAGLDSWYLEGQLQAFKKGFRGGSKDGPGEVMRVIANTLKDDEIKSVVKYISSL